MRTGTRNWIVALCVAGLIIFFVGKLSNGGSAEAVQAADTRTVMERYISAYSQYTQAELDRFQKYQSAIAQSDWDSFWAMLVRVTLASAVIISGIFLYRAMPVVIEHYKMRQRLFKTDMGVVVLGYDEHGNIIGRSIEPNIEKASPKPATGKAMVINDRGRESVVIDNDSGRFVDIYADVADFLEKALINSDDDNARELPRHDKMGVGGSRWDRMVNGVLKDFLTVQNTGEGVRTFCSSAEYPTLRTMFIATRRHKLPLPDSGSAKKTKKGA